MSSSGSTAKLLSGRSENARGQKKRRTSKAVLLVEDPAVQDSVDAGRSVQVRKSKAKSMFMKKPVARSCVRKGLLARKASSKKHARSSKSSSSSSSSSSSDSSSSSESSQSSPENAKGTSDLAQVVHDDQAFDCCDADKHDKQSGVIATKNDEKPADTKFEVHTPPKVISKKRRINMKTRDSAVLGNEHKVTDNHVTAAADKHVTRAVVVSQQSSPPLPAPATMEEVESWAGEAATICKAISDGVTPTVLPAELAKRLAAVSRWAKMCSWSQCAEGDYDTSSKPASLQLLAPLGKHFSGGILSAVFEALSQSDLLSINLDEKELLGRQASNLEFGLHLTTMYLDTRAILGAPPTDSSGHEDIDPSVTKFLSATIRAMVAIGNTSANSRITIPPPIAQLTELLGTSLRCIHHALAAVRYTSIPLAHRAVPLAARCLGSSSADAKPYLRPLCCAAMDLLTALFGQAEPQLQELATEALIEASDASRAGGGSAGGHANPSVAADPKASALAQLVANSRRGGKKKISAEPSVYTRTVLSAILSSCLPVGFSHAANKLCMKELAEMTSTCLGLASARAAELATGILRRCLLGAERDSTSWFRLEMFVQELLHVRSDPNFATAPLLLLCITKGLVKIARAAQSVAMSWTQREFAVRLLGHISMVLCQDHASVSAEDSLHFQADVDAIRKWCTSGDCWLELATSGMPKHEYWWPVARYVATSQVLSDDKVNPQVLLPPSHSPEACIDGAVLPAKHPLYSSSFLLCSWAAEKSPDDEQKRTKKSRARSVQKDTLKNQSDSPVETLEPAVSWAVSMWAKCSTVCAEKPSAIRSLVVATTKNDKARDAVSTRILRLYRAELHRDGIGELSRARVVALEALLSQMKSSPLVFVRRQAINSLTAACRANVQFARSRCVGDGVLTCLQDDSSLVRLPAIEFASYLASSNDEVNVADGLEQDPVPDSAPQGVSPAAFFRAAVRARIGDPSAAVRRVAFRNACSNLRPDEIGLKDNVADLLRRIKQEPQQVRDVVLQAAQRAMLASAEASVALDHLAKLTKETGVGGPCVRDLIIARRNAGSATFAQSMCEVAMCAFSQVASRDSDDDAMSCALVLEQIGLELPSALHAHVPKLLAWIQVELGTHAVQNKMCLSLQGCRILSDLLPTWMGAVGMAEQNRILGELRESLDSLLHGHGYRASRSASECLCVIANNVGDPAQLLLHFDASVAHIAGVVDRREALNASAQEVLACHAWIVGSILEFADLPTLRGMRATHATESSNTVSKNDADKAMTLLIELCLCGPTALRPILLPALCFLLRRHSRLLRADALQALHDGLSGNSLFSASPFAVAARACAAEALAGLLGSFEQSATSGAPPPGAGAAAAAAAVVVAAPVTAQTADADVTVLLESVIEFIVDGDLYTAKVISDRPTATSRKKGMTHEVEYLAGAKGKECVALDAQKQMLRDGYDHEVSYTIKVPPSEVPAGSGQEGESAASVAVAAPGPAVAEAVQRLATLQPEVFNVLQEVDAPGVADNCLRALQSMSSLGVLHPASAVPSLLAACLAGPAEAVAMAAPQPLLLKLLEATPQHLISRLGQGARQASELLASRGANLGAAGVSVRQQRSRFAAVCEAWSELLGAGAGTGSGSALRGQRMQLLNATLAEFAAMASLSMQDVLDTKESAPVANPCSGASESTCAMLHRAALLAGILEALPYRSEAEVAHVVSSASRLLTLRAVPLLPDFSSCDDAEAGAVMVRVVTVAITLHGLCKHLCDAAGGAVAERLKAAAAGKAVDDEDRLLPLCFSRRAPLDLSPALRDLAALTGSDDAGAATTASPERVSVAGTAEALIGVLAEHVPADSPFLRGGGGQAGARPEHPMRRCRGERRAGGPKLDSSAGAAGRGRGRGAGKRKFQIEPASSRGSEELGEDTSALLSAAGA